MGAFDVLPSLNEEEPLMIRLYYPTKRKCHEVPQSQLIPCVSSNAYRYTKAVMIANNFVSSFFAAPMAYLATKLSSK